MRENNDLKCTTFPHKKKCEKFVHVRPLHGLAWTCNQYKPNGDPDPVIRLITKRQE